jgi:hypothetical protein
MHQRFIADPESLERIRSKMFRGFPYLVTPIVPALYHLMLLPSSRSEKELVRLAVLQVSWNRLKSCLVLGERRQIYIGEDCRVDVVDSPPYSTFAACERIAPAFAVELDKEFLERAGKLRCYVESTRSEGYLFGDLTKGGRSATKEELAKLGGKSREGVPLGLRRCPRCGEWAGECIDPSPQFANQVMKVHCRCQNINRCARCGELFHEHKLNANYFKKSDGQIWHVPAFSVLSHTCPGCK